MAMASSLEESEKDMGDFSSAGDHCQKVEKLVLDLKQKYERIFNSISEIQNTLIEEKLTDKSKNVFYILPAGQVNVVDHAQLFAKSLSDVSTALQKQDTSLSDQSAGDHILKLMNSSTKLADDDEEINQSMGDHFNKVTKIDKTTKNKRKIVHLGDSHHQWVKKLVENPTKCLACMMDLPLRRHCAQCFLCKSTVHHLCAENLYNTCGCAILSSDQYRKEETEMLRKFKAIHVCGWVKVWHPTNYTWLSLWASLENEILSFFDSNNQEKDDESSGAVFPINIKNCRLNIRLNENVDLFSTNEDRQPLPMQKFEWNICFRIDASNQNNDRDRAIFIIAPDLPSKQRWLGALRKFSV